MRREAKHVHRKLTPEERLQVAAARKQVEGEEKPEILRKAKQYKKQADAAKAALRDAMQLLKSERLRQGLSLSDVEKRTGIERPNLSRLENEADANPTIATLMRYADALGKRLLIVLADTLPSKSSSHA